VLKSFSGIRLPLNCIQIIVIRQPLDRSIIDTGNHAVEGIAWTGMGMIQEVEVSTDGGKNWSKAELTQDLSQPYS